MYALISEEILGWSTCTKILRSIVESCVVDRCHLKFADSCLEAYVRFVLFIVHSHTYARTLLVTSS
jgi:hypothetical protein